MGSGSSATQFSALATFDCRLGLSFNIWGTPPTPVWDRASINLRSSFYVGPRFEEMKSILSLSLRSLNLTLGNYKYPSFPSLSPLPIDSPASTLSAFFSQDLTSSGIRPQSTVEWVFREGASLSEENDSSEDVQDVPLSMAFQAFHVTIFSRISAVIESLGSKYFRFLSGLSAKSLSYFLNPNSPSSSQSNFISTIVPWTVVCTPILPQ